VVDQAATNSSLLLNSTAFNPQVTPVDEYTLGTKQYTIQRQITRKAPLHSNLSPTPRDPFQFNSFPQPGLVCAVSTITVPNPAKNKKEQNHISNSCQNSHHHFSFSLFSFAASRSNSSFDYHDSISRPVLDAIKWVRGEEGGGRRNVEMGLTQYW